MSDHDNLRKYGEPPFSVAVIHGGPGAAGAMAPVARELSRSCGVLEPLQTAASIDGQVGELRGLLEGHGQPPMTLIGHSWGAWLGLIFTVCHPSMVKKLILVACPAFEVKYATGIMETRFGRMGEDERGEAYGLMTALNDPRIKNKNAAFARFGELMAKADAFDPIAGEDAAVEFREDIYQSVSREADALRRGGELLRLAGRVRCPVVAVHGDYDPHTAEGVEKPLKGMVKDFRLILLEGCGHEPWMERRAKDRFYEILKEELK